MKVLVIGGTRFIGPPTVRALASRGAEIVRMNRGKTPLKHPDQFPCITADRNDLDALARVIAEVRPEVIVDMMAVDSAHGQQLIDAADGTVRRIVLVSSVDVYRNFGILIGSDSGEPDPAPLIEESPLRDSRYPYATADSDWRKTYDKIPIEESILGEEDLEGVVVRLPMVYGEDDYQNRTAEVLARVRDGRNTLVMSQEQAHWTAPRGFVDNMGEAIALAAYHPEAAGTVFHVADAESLTELEWTEAVLKAAGSSIQVRVLPSDELPEGLKNKPLASIELDSNKIRKHLGFEEIVGFEEGLKRTVAWQLDNMPEASHAETYKLEDTV